MALSAPVLLNTLVIDHGAVCYKVVIKLGPEVRLGSTNQRPGFTLADQSEACVGPGWTVMKLPGTGLEAHGHYLALYGSPGAHPAVLFQIEN